MPMFESSVAMTTSQHAEQRGVAGEAVAGVDADERDEPRQLGDVQEREAVEAGRTRRLGVAGSPAAAFGEEHDRQPQLGGELEEPVLLAVVLRALRAGEDGVVVRRDDAPGRVPVEAVAVDRADAADEAVGRACWRSGRRARGAGAARRSRAARTR